MQLYGLNVGQQAIYAGLAEKHKNYQCLECGQWLRLRSGFHRQPHFYHLHPNQKCRQNGKSMPHLMLQHALRSLLPEGEAELEFRFPSISRVADVAWLTKNIIFEVQCSPITANEVARRNADYASVGYRVVWLLHEARFNQFRLSAAEDFLKDSSHYFTDMDKAGSGVIYDQPSLIVSGVRKKKLPRVIVDVSLPRRNLIDGALFNGLRDLPKIISDRHQSWKLCFKGDYIDRLHSDEGYLIYKEAIDEMRDAESLFGHISKTDWLSMPIVEALKLLVWKFVARPYQIVLRFLLERACR